MRIQDKIKEIENYLSELAGIAPEHFDEYDIKTKDACERYFEVIVQAVVDLAFLVIKENGLKTPEDEREAFDILAEEKIIPEELAQKLKDAKGMRNIIAHQYGSIDDRVVFESITKELGKDVRMFVQKARNISQADDMKKSRRR